MFDFLCIYRALISNKRFFFCVADALGCRGPDLPAWRRSGSSERLHQEAECAAPGHAGRVAAAAPGRHSAGDAGLALHSAE